MNEIAFNSPDDERNLSMDDINTRIQNELCRDTIEELSDEKLMDQYKESPSLKKNIKKLSDVLGKYIDEETKEKIIQDYILQLISPGTKGSIRGNEFNKKLKQFISHLGLDTERFDIQFEKTHDVHVTTEIPDGYISDKSTNKTIIIMNQLDLWGGGHQTNRGAKYLVNNEHNNENCKLLCVVCNEIQFKSNKNKAYKLFEIGFKNDTLCYLNNLQNIIYSYFNLE